MRKTILTLFCLLIIACNKDTAVKPKDTAVKPENIGESRTENKETEMLVGCENALRESLSQPHPQKNTNAVPNPMSKPVKIFGVRVREKIQNVYALSVDTEQADGQRVQKDAVCKQFSAQGKPYWTVKFTSP
jgi:hypothetical protein